MHGMTRRANISRLGGSSLLALLLIAGCAGGDRYAAEATEIARVPLPDTREVPHAPDSLVHLTIVEKENHLEFKLERSYEQMLRAWSAGPRGSFARNFHNFATLWSLELSLASLVPGRGIEKLSKDLTQKIIRRRKEDFQETIQIDVYRFDEPPYGSIANLWLDNPGTTVYLEDAQGRRYEPVRIETSNRPAEVFFAGHTALYGRSRIFFDRIVNGRDLLKDTRGLRLMVQAPYPTTIADRRRFAWEFPSHRQRASVGTGQ